MINNSDSISELVDRATDSTVAIPSNFNINDYIFAPTTPLPTNSTREDLITNNDNKFIKRYCLLFLCIFC